MGETAKEVPVRPTFCIDDPEQGTLVFRPDDYADYEYSRDGDWLTLYFDERENATRKRTFWIRYE